MIVLVHLVAEDPGAEDVMAPAMLLGTAELGLPYAVGAGADDETGLALLDGDGTGAE